MADEKREPQEDTELFTEFMSPNVQGMMQLHQMFVDMVRAGFTEAQANGIIGALLAALMTGAQPPGV